MKKLLILPIFLIACIVPEPIREKHNYECFDTIKMENYNLIRFICKDPDCYKIDSFKLYK